MSDSIDICRKQSKPLEVDLDIDSDLSKEDIDNSDSVTPASFPTHDVRNN